MLGFISFNRISLSLGIFIERIHVQGNPYDVLIKQAHFTYPYYFLGASCFMINKVQSSSRNSILQIIVQNIVSDIYVLK